MPVNLQVALSIRGTSWRESLYTLRIMLLIFCPHEMVIVFCASCTNVIWFEILLDISYISNISDSHTICIQSLVCKTEALWFYWLLVMNPFCMGCAINQIGCLYLHYLDNINMWRKSPNNNNISERRHIANKLCGLFSGCICNYSTAPL